MQINNITDIKRKPDASGFYHANLKPLTGNVIPVSFSKGAVKDMERLVLHVNADLEKEASKAPKTTKSEDDL